MTFPTPTRAGAGAPRSGPRLALAALVLAGLAGCAGLKQPPAGLEQAGGCPTETAADLAARRDRIGPDTASPELQCALALLRETRDPALTRSALGSRVALLLAERATVPDRRDQLAAEGVRSAEQALAQGADGDGAVHYYLAANLGLAVREHPTQAAANLARLEREMQRAVALNPGLDDGGPLRLLGMLYLKAPPWPTGIGDGDKALELLERAARQYPGHPLNHLFHAEALWEVEGGKAAARVRAELAQGHASLRRGDWGYRREPFEREFVRFEREFGEASS